MYKTTFFVFVKRTLLIPAFRGSTRFEKRVISAAGLFMVLWLMGHLANGQCTLPPTSITVTGIAPAFAAVVDGVYQPSGTENGAPRWAGPNSRILKWTGSRWQIGIQVNEETYFLHVYNTTGSITNLPCTGWQSDNGYGNPTFSGGCGALTAATLPVGITPSAATFIDGQDVTLVASGASSYTWSTGQTGSSITVSPVSTTAYSVTGSSGVCSATAMATATLTQLTSPAAALHFDGADDYLESINNIGITGNSNRTIEAWVKTTQTSGQAVIADMGTNGTGTRFTFNVLNGLLRIEIQGGGINGGSIADGSWHHVAVSYDNALTNQYNLYIDGVLSTSNTIATALNSTASNLRIGRKLDNSGPFNGSIDEVRIWNRALTSTEISSSYACELSNGQTGLVAYYKLNQGNPGGTNTGLINALDDSGNNNKAALTNFALTGGTSNWIEPGGVTSGFICGTTPPLAVTITPRSQTITPGQSVTLIASSGAPAGSTSYTWSTGQSTSAIVVSPTSTTAYSVTATGPAGATGIASATVTVGPCPFVPQSITATGFSSAFNAVVGGVYQPSGTENGAPRWAGPNSRILKWTGSRWQIGVQVNEETYFLHVYNTTGSITNLPCTGWQSDNGYGNPIMSGGCGEFTAGPKVTIAAIPSLTVVQGNSLTLTASGANTYRWSNGATTASISLTPGANASFTVTGTTTGCSNTAVASVTVNSLVLSISAISSVVLGPGNCPARVSFTGSGNLFYLAGPSNYEFYILSRTPLVNERLQASGIKVPGTYAIGSFGNNGQSPVVVTFQVTGTGCP